MKRSPIIAFIYLLSIILSLGAVSFQPDTQQEKPEPLVIQLTANGPITPVLSEYINRGIELAKADHADAIVLELNTPGGDIELMNKIVQQIRGSEIPFIVYVSPQNAMAASAGTLITLAGHVAAMAPETTIGAASPVGSQGEDIGTTMQSKIKEALRAQVRAIAANRPPAAIALAEDTIENAKAATVEEALAIGLVDIKAVDMQDLLTQLDGRVVTINNQSVTMQTQGAQIQILENTFIEQILLMLVNPNLVFILLALGVQAILIEISHPGGWVAGFVGAVSILLATYGLGILPVNWFGAFLMGVAFVLFILDIKAPTHGALTIAGTISFISGALILFNTTRWPGFPMVNVWLVVFTGLSFAAIFLLLLGFALRAQKEPIKIGQESMPGKTGWAASELSNEGLVKINGELWQAVLAEEELPVKDGEDVEVVGNQGLRLIVRKKKQ
jgi:membrane-bound serine protease (ClpP class)